MSKEFKITGIGELLWDVLPEGKQLGGAPCNFAFHAHQCGCDSSVVSAVGFDIDGKEIIEKITELGFSSQYVQLSTRYPTGTVSVELNESGLPHYTIHEGVAWDQIEFKDSLNSLAQEVDAVCFGSLAQRNDVSRTSIMEFIQKTKAKCLRVFDINLRQSFYNKEIIENSLALANVLKLNDDELPIVSSFLNIEGDEEIILNMLLIKYDLKLIAYTKGDKGSILVTDTERSFCEVPKIKVADTVGAGDSFTAVLIAGMLNKVDLKKIHEAATSIAAFVCTQKGATPVLPDHLLNQIK